MDVWLGSTIVATLPSALVSLILQYYTETWWQALALIDSFLAHVHSISSEHKHRITITKDEELSLNCDMYMQDLRREFEGWTHYVAQRQAFSCIVSFIS